MTQVFLSSPTFVTLSLERGRVLSLVPGVSAVLTVAIPGESVAQPVAAPASFGPYEQRREATLNLSLGTAVYEVLESAAGGGGELTADAIADTLETAPPADLTRIQAAVSTAPAVQAALFGTNNIVNGGFDDATGWTLTAGFSISGGILTSSANTGKFATNTATVMAGGVYTLLWYQVGTGSNDTKIVVKTPADNFLIDYDIIGTGPRSLTFQAPVSGNIAFFNYASGCTYDNVVMLRIA